MAVETKKKNNNGNEGGNAAVAKREAGTEILAKQGIRDVSPLKFVENGGPGNYRTDKAKALVGLAVETGKGEIVEGDLTFDFRFSGFLPPVSEGTDSYVGKLRESIAERGIREPVTVQIPEGLRIVDERLVRDDESPGTLTIVPHRRSTFLTLGA